MSLMKKLFEQFEDEVEGVEEYSKCAKEYKEEDPTLSKMYLDMAQAELQHAQLLQAQIGKQASTHEMSPEEAVMILDELWKDKQKQMDCDLAKAKAMLDLTK